MFETAASRLRALFSLTRHHLHQAGMLRAELGLEAARNAESIRQERAAKRRALGLLIRLLDPTQRAEFRHALHFHVVGAGTGERYRIRVESIANIDVLGDDGRVKYRLCVQPGSNVPIYDALASQMLQLQDPVAEVRLLKQANVVPAPMGLYWYSNPPMIV